MNENKSNPMKTKAVLPLLMSMAIPPMISMLIQSLYNIIDSIYVAQINNQALTVVSLIFPLQNIVLAVAIGFGVGVSALIAINLGAKNKEGVNQAATHGLVLSGLHSLLFIVVGLLFTKPFLRMFTTDPTIFKWGTSYSYIVTCFSFGVCFMLVFEKIFQANGNMVIPMMVQAIGCIINIVLDPILIFGKFGFPAMGVVGAAIATVFAQITTFVIYIFIFRKKNFGIHLNFKHFRFDFAMVKKLYSVGIPSSIMMALPSLVVSMLNGILTSISTASIAVLGIYFKLQTFVYMPASGLVQGMRPIVSYNYGANDMKRVNETIKKALLVTIIIMTLGTIICMGLPTQIMNLFNADESLLLIGIPALRIISTGFIVSSLATVVCGAFEALGMGSKSLILSLLRQLIILIPVAFVLSRFLSVNGVWMAFPIAETITAIVSLLFLKKYIK